MAQYGWWPNQSRPGGWGRSGYDREMAPRWVPWRRPHWWGDPNDPRYAGFDLPRRYGSRDYGRYDAIDYRPGWPENQPSEYSRYGRTLNDKELQSAVRRKFLEDGSLQADRIQVEVNDRVVTLSGTVTDYLQARYAWDDAWETDGVEGVISRIEVEPSAEEADQEG